MKEPFPSVLLSLSGEDGYRNNSITAAGGIFLFDNLFPGSFYLRPLLKVLSGIQQLHHVEVLYYLSSFFPWFSYPCFSIKYVQFWILITWISINLDYVMTTFELLGSWTFWFCSINVFANSAGSNTLHQLLNQFPSWIHFMLPKHESVIFEIFRISIPMLFLDLRM